jgi:hypothetical protein
MEYQLPAFLTQSTMRWTYSTSLDDLWSSLYYLLQTCKTTFFEHSLYIVSVARDTGMSKEIESNPSIEVFQWERFTDG